MAMATDIFGMNRQSITESFDDYGDINLEAELANVEPLEEGVDPMEYMVQVACECEIDMQRIEMGIVSEEYAYLRENGEEMVYEASSANGIIDKFKKWIDKLWASIQKFFRSVLSKFSERFLTDKQFAKRYENKVKNVQGIAVGLTLDQYDKATDALASYLLKCAAACDKVGSSLEDSEEYNDKIASLKRFIFGASNIKDEDDSVSKILNNVVLKNMKRTKVMIGDASVCIKHLKFSEIDKKALEKMYKDSKKIIENAKKAAKRLESYSRKWKVLPTEESSKIHRTVKCINKIGNWCTQTNKCAVQMINEKSKFCRAIVIDAMSTKKDGKDVKNAIKKSGLSKDDINDRYTNQS